MLLLSPLNVELSLCEPNAYPQNIHVLFRGSNKPRILFILETRVYSLLIAFEWVKCYIRDV